MSQPHANLAVNGSFVHDGWPDFFSRVLRPFELRQLEELRRVVGFAPLLRGIEDRLVWEPNVHGVFSVSELSSLMHSFDLSSDLMGAFHVWDVGVPPKIQCFLWFGLLGRLSTLAMLSDRGIDFGGVSFACVIGTLLEINLVSIHWKEYRYPSSLMELEYRYWISSTGTGCLITVYGVLLSMIPYVLVLEIVMYDLMSLNDPFDSKFHTPACNTTNYMLRAPTKAPKKAKRHWKCSAKVGFGLPEHGECAGCHSTVNGPPRGSKRRGGQLKFQTNLCMDISHEECPITASGGHRRAHGMQWGRPRAAVPATERR
ncbi:hypothetical protein GQ457_14G017570 [Hibiscus cannabinus]